ncbi:MAG: hypothetical protein JOY57_02625 [Actinobacteria bacterium]|nr:hypothetical protein [Actinomycetota bacterium]
MTRPAARAVVALVAAAWLAACGTTVPAARRNAAAAGHGSDVGAGASAAASAAGDATAGSSGEVLGSTVGGTEQLRQSGSGSTGGAAASQAKASAAAAAAKAPISVGFMVSDFTKTAAAFGITGPPSDRQTAFKGLVAYYNKRGGFAGRQIKPVYYTLDASSSDWNVADQAACATFTQDNHVEVVISEDWVHENLVQCLLNAGVPMVDGSISPQNDRKGLAKLSNLFVVDAVEADRSAVALIDSSVKAGWLGSKDKLGVAVDSCPWDTRTANEVLPAKARQYGFQLDVVNAADCGIGFSDVGKFTAGMQNAAFRLHADGANKIMILTQGANGGLTFFATGADSQGWHPDYLVDSGTAPAATQAGGTLPAGQLPNIKGLGWVPLSDVANAKPSDVAKSCVAISVEGGSQQPASDYEFGSRYSSCSAFWAAAAVLAKTQGRAGLATFRAGMEQVGRAVTSAITLSGAMLLDANHHAGAAMASRFQFNQACSCFQYVGSPEPLP